MTHVRDRLVDLILEALEPAERDDVEAHLGACPECARDLAELQSSLAGLPLALPRAAPAPSLRARIDASLDHLERFARFAPRVAELLAIAPNEARRALHVYERPEQMPPTAHAGYRAQPIIAGPDRPGVTGKLAYFEPGCVLPHHVHDQEELVLVFQGAFEADGAIYRAGDEAISAPGTGHVIRIAADEPCMSLIVSAPRSAHRERPGRADR